MLVFLVAVFGLSVSPSYGNSPGPTSGEFSAWTKMLANGSQVKFYAKYPQEGQKIQFLVQDEDGIYREQAWLRVTAGKHLNDDGSYKNLQNDIYFIRTVDLREGKNRVRIAVDGEIVWGTKTYVPKPPSEEPVVDTVTPPAEEPAFEEPIEEEIPFLGGGGGVGAPAPAPAPAPTVGSLSLTDATECQLLETENRTAAGPKGFPQWSYIATTDVVRIAMIPVDFSNAVGDPSLIAGYAGEGAKVEAWAQQFARGKMSYEVQWNADSWIRAPKEAQWYGMIAEKGGQLLQSRAEALQQLVDAADSRYDFTDVDMIYFIFPVQAEAEFGAAMYDQSREFTSEEGTFTTSVYGEMGGYFNANSPRSVWDHLVHEILHYQGLQGHGPANGFDAFISTNQWGQAKAMPMWEQFLVGWVNDDDVACITKESIRGIQSITFSPTDAPASGAEAVFIKLNDEELIAIEYREIGPYNTWATGLTAYRLNVNDPYVRRDDLPILEAEALNWWSFIRQGESELITDVTAAGIRIRSRGNGEIWLSVE